MKKIDSKIILNVVDRCLNSCDVVTSQELAMCHSIEFVDEFCSVASEETSVEQNKLEDVSLHCLYVEDSDKYYTEADYDENLIKIRNNGVMPLGLSIEQFNALDLGYYTWVEYGDYNEKSNKLDVIYYDAEAIEGVNVLFELPFFKRQLLILENYLKEKQLLENGAMITQDVEIIKGFNQWHMSRLEESESIVSCINELLELSVGK